MPNLKGDCTNKLEKCFSCVQFTVMAVVIIIVYICVAIRMVCTEQCDWEKR